MKQNLYKRIMELPAALAEQIWLENRLSDLSAKEELLLSGMILKANPQNGRTLIDLFRVLPECEICYPVSSYETLGKFVVEQEYQMSEPQLIYIDMEKLGKKYADLHPGVFMGDAFVVYPKEASQKQYADQFPPDCGWSVKLKMASAKNPDGVWLRLPDHFDAEDGRPDEVRIALDALGVEKVYECTLLEARCILPEIGDLTAQYTNPADLVYDGNELGFLLEKHGLDNFLTLFSAALEYEDSTRLDVALDIAENLSRYELVSVTGLEEYAKTILNRFDITMSNLVAAAFDYEKYAQDHLESRGFILSRDESMFIGKSDALMLAPCKRNNETCGQSAGQYSNDNSRLFGRQAITLEQISGRCLKFLTEYDGSEKLYQMLHSELELTNAEIDGLGFDLAHRFEDEPGMTALRL